MAEDGPAQRVSPVIFPQSWELPERPQSGGAASIDAHRQTEFVLRSDLRLLHEGMNLQLRVIADTYPSRYRTYPAAVAQLYWSRVFHYLADAALLVTRGSYVSVPALARTACECFAGMAQLSADELPEFLEFMRGTLRPHEALRATNVGRGSYHAGGTLAREPRLGLIYRASTEFNRPHFGASLLEVASESNLQKLAVVFGDQAFHFGWAQLELGWLISLCNIVLGHVLERGGLYGTTNETEAAIQQFQQRAGAALAGADRCSVEQIEVDGDQHFLIHNFRRQPGGAPRKIVL
jgi:hypothetical protein